jgi:molybdenum cofactor cytidylyltransferase
MSVAVLLLAAGAGRRFGGDKLLYPITSQVDRAPMGLISAANLQAAGLAPLVIVRAGDPATFDLFAGYEVLISPESAGGMGHSIAAGVAARPNADGWLVALADMPFVRSTTHRALVDEFARLARASAIIRPRWQGRFGQPVILGSAYRQDLLALTGDFGARHILAQHHAEIYACDVDDEGISLDIDEKPSRGVKFGSEPQSNER